MNLKLVIGVLIVITGIALVNADFEFGDQDVEKDYSGGELLKGEFNMSFSNQTNLNFTSSLGGTRSLLDVLQGSFVRGNDYTCRPSNCMSDFSAASGQTSKTISLSGNEVKKFGFVFSGNDVSVRNNEFNLRVVSDASQSCVNQVSIDLFDDGEVDFFNDKYVDELCGVKSYGCFDKEDSSGEAEIPTTSSYCENITLPASPAYRVGAKVRNSTEGKGDLTMEMFDMETEDSLGVDCVLPAHTQEVENLDCIINYSASKQFDALVCISAEFGNYKIREESEEPCGMLGKFNDFESDYEIYAQGLKFDVTSTEFDDESYTSLNPNKEISEELQDYIDDVYNSDCTGNCVIPFSIWGVSQDVTLDSLMIKYDKSGALGKESKEIYEVDEDEFEISSDFLEFEIEDLGFIAPNITGKKTFRLEFDGNSLFSEKINVTTGFSFNIKPKFVLIGRRTLFEVIILGNVSKTEWDFNGTSLSSNTKGINYKFEEEGDFDIEVEVTKLSGKKSTKKFTITVGDAKTSANLTIQDYEKRIANITSEFNSLPGWVKVEVEKQINIIELNNSIARARDDFELGSSDDDYLEVVNKLGELNVPYSISKSSGGTTPIESGLDGIDVSYIEEISTREAEDEDDLIDAISSWISANYDINIEYDVISAFGDEGKSDLVTKFKVKINGKTGASSEGIYLFIDFPFDEVVFASDSGRSVGQGAGTYVFFAAPDEAGDVEFLIPERIDIQDLGVYISPEVSKLTIESGRIEGPGGEKKFKTGGFTLWIIVLLVVVLVIYVILQEWYKRNYESRLFKNKDDLYNLINFVFNGRAHGLKDGEVRHKLGGSGWRGEQINYAIRKLDGKRTGMWEIPILKFFEKRKVRQELGKRGHSEMNTKFIKQPRF